MRVAIVCTLCASLASCYKPTDFAACSLACEPTGMGGDCPDGMLCREGVCAGAGDECPATPDDGPVANCPGTGLLTELCPPSGALMDRVFEGDILDTLLCANGGGIFVDADLPYCVVHGGSIQVIGPGLRATGVVPLVLVSHTTMLIDGTLDAGSHNDSRGDGAGANRQCEPGIGDGTDGNLGTPTSGGGGGAGGSYQGRGGSGGVGESGGPVANGGAPGNLASLMLRAGCPGGAGGDDGFAQPNPGPPGGSGGGMIYLVARDSISITGAARILANGAGGEGGNAGATGGGGGGSGGAIVFDTPSIFVSGGTPQVCANGGGGGGGAEGSGKGAPGEDGCVSQTSGNVAAGGEGGVPGDGEGDGGVGGTLAGAANGGASVDGGGGGGGGTGYIQIFNAENTLGTNVSPAVIVKP